MQVLRFAAVFLLVLAAVATLRPVSAAAPATATTTVFELGERKQSPYGFRIPALVATASGRLLAFCERRVGLHDHAENDIVLRTSHNGGRDWGPLQIVSQAGRDSLNDPCAVVLGTGRILLRYTRFPQGVHARKSDHTVMAEPGYGGPKNVRIYLTHSDDDGRTWSEPRDTTRTMRRQQAISLGSPGVGSQLTRGEKRGRILLPNYEVYRQDKDQRFSKNSVSYSDDQGKTWQLSATIDDTAVAGFGNEAQLAELSDGRIMLSSRHYPDHKGRLISYSDDAGETWSRLQLSSDLLTPACMSSVIRYSGADSHQGDVLLHSLPHSRDSRSNGTLMVSRDDGRSWKPLEVIAPQGFAYSCLARLPGGDVGCLYETDEYHKIEFLRLKPETIFEQ